MDGSVSISLRNFVGEGIIKIYYICVCICSLITIHEKTFIDHIMSLEWDAWAYKTSLTPPCFIEVVVSSQDRQLSCICVLQEFILSMFLRLFD
jgi:hypothetical protein